jgi:hypothetical protein
VLAEYKKAFMAFDSKTMQKAEGVLQEYFHVDEVGSTVQTILHYAHIFEYDGFIATADALIKKLES